MVRIQGPTAWLVWRRGRGGCIPQTRKRGGRIAYTLPGGAWNLAVATLLVTFEALPIVGMVLKTVTLWNIDCLAPSPVTKVPGGMRVAVLIPTYNEPVEVLA